MCLLFFDIKSAFYMLLRQLVVDIGEDDTVFLRLLHQMHVPPAALAELTHHLQGMAAVPAAGASPHLSAMTADLFRGSWFRLEGSTAVALTRRGTRPGDPTADVLYSFCLAALHKCMDQALESQGLLPQVPVLATPALLPALPTTQTLAVASWADDCLRFSDAPNLSELVDNVTQVFQVCFERATAMGIEFSCGPDKTAALFSDAPPRKLPGSTGELTPQTLCVRNSLLCRTHEVQSVPAYKYLGGIVTTDGHPRAEILYRKSLALGIARPLARPFFACSAFPLTSRRALLHALSVSRFVYGSVALRLSCPQHRRIWYQGYLHLWRTLLRPRPNSTHRPHALAVLHAAQSASPPLALAHMRATFLRRLATRGPSAVMTVLQRHWELAPSQSWLGQLALDVKLVCQYVEGARVLTGGTCVVRSLFDAVAEDPAWWVRMVKKAVKVNVQDINAWTKRLQQPATPGRVPAPASTAVEEDDECRLPFCCSFCGRRFALRKNLCSHELLKHQRWSPVRHFTYGEHCIVCLRWWHSAKRVQAHLRLDNNCLVRAVFLAPPLSHAEILIVESADKQRHAAVRKGNWRQNASVLPPQQCAGPPQLTRQERQAYLDEETLLSDLRCGFLPQAEHVRWIQDYLAARSVEGARHFSEEFWHSRSSLPSSVGLNVSPAW